MKLSSPLLRHYSLLIRISKKRHIPAEVFLLHLGNLKRLSSIWTVAKILSWVHLMNISLLLRYPVAQILLKLELCQSIFDPSVEFNWLPSSKTMVSLEREGGNHQVTASALFPYKPCQKD